MKNFIIANLRDMGAYLIDASHVIEGKHEVMDCIRVSANFQPEGTLVSRLTEPVFDLLTRPWR